MELLSVLKQDQQKSSQSAIDGHRYADDQNAFLTMLKQGHPVIEKFSIQNPRVV
jgi:hypothetical protein